MNETFKYGRQSLTRRMKSTSKIMWACLTSLWDEGVFPTHVDAGNITPLTIRGLFDRGFIIAPDVDRPFTNNTCNPQYEEALKKFIGYNETDTKQETPTHKNISSSVAQMDELLEEGWELLRMIWDDKPYPEVMKYAEGIAAVAVIQLAKFGFISMDKVGNIIVSDRDTVGLKAYIDYEEPKESDELTEKIKSISKEGWALLRSCWSGHPCSWLLSNDELTDKAFAELQTLGFFNAPINEFDKLIISHNDELKKFIGYGGPNNSVTPLDLGQSSSTPTDDDEPKYVILPGRIDAISPDGWDLLKSLWNNRLYDGGYTLERGTARHTVDALVTLGFIKRYGTDGIIGVSKFERILKDRCPSLTKPKEEPEFKNPLQMMEVMNAAQWDILLAIWRGDTQSSIIAKLVELDSGIRHLRACGFLASALDGWYVPEENEAMLKDYIGYKEDGVDATLSLEDKMKAVSDEGWKFLHALWNNHMFINHSDTHTHGIVEELRDLDFVAIDHNRQVLLVTEYNEELKTFCGFYTETNAAEQYKETHKGNEEPWKHADPARRSMFDSNTDQLYPNFKDAVPEAHIGDHTILGDKIQEYNPTPKEMQYLRTGIKVDLIPFDTSVLVVRDCNRALTDMVFIKIIEGTLRSITHTEVLNIKVFITMDGYITLGSDDMARLQLCKERMMNCNMAYWFGQTVRANNCALQWELQNANIK